MNREIYFVHDQQEGPHARQGFLEMAGYKVTCMKGADQCMVMLRERKPALLLLDVLIEGRTGFELARDVRLHFTPQQLPIVMCSQVYRSRAFREEARTVGVDRYMLQPIRLDELVDAVNELVDGNASAAA
jgi:DNA-binding response OmpR family regulator